MLSRYSFPVIGLTRAVVSACARGAVVSLDMRTLPCVAAAFYPGDTPSRTRRCRDGIASFAAGMTSCSSNNMDAPSIRGVKRADHRDYALTLICQLPIMRLDHDRYGVEDGRRRPRVNPGWCEEGQDARSQNG